MQQVGIGRDRVLVFGLNGVMISIKIIYMHIGHDSSIGVCFSKRSRIALHRVSDAAFSPPFQGRWRVGRD